MRRLRPEEVNLIAQIGCERIIRTHGGVRQAAESARVDESVRVTALIQPKIKRTRGRSTDGANRLTRRERNVRAIVGARFHRFVRGRVRLAVVPGLTLDFRHDRLNVTEEQLVAAAGSRGDPVIGLAGAKRRR